MESMAEQVIHTLNAKRHEIESHIGSLEQDLEQARRDLARPERRFDRDRS